MTPDTAASLSAQDIYEQLQSLPGPLFQAPSPVRQEGKIPQLQGAIASLLVHALLEASLHLLNHSLYAPHFILRKMQNSRGGQHLHGVLHRVEGDYENARVWYREASGTERPLLRGVTTVEGERVFVEFWCEQGRMLEGTDTKERESEARRAREAAVAFVDRVQRMKEGSKGQVADAGAGTAERAELERVSKAELNAVAEWGGGPGARDARGAYTGNTKAQKELFRKQMGEGVGASFWIMDLVG